MEFQIVWVPGSLVAKFAKKAAGSQLGLKLKCKTPVITSIQQLQSSSLIKSLAFLEDGTKALLMGRCFCHIL